VRFGAPRSPVAAGSSLKTACTVEVEAETSAHSRCCSETSTRSVPCRVAMRLCSAARKDSSRDRTAPPVDHLGGREGGSEHRGEPCGGEGGRVNAHLGGEEGQAKAVGGTAHGRNKARWGGVCTGLLEQCFAHPAREWEGLPRITSAKMALKRGDVLSLRTWSVRMPPLPPCGGTRSARSPWLPRPRLAPVAPPGAGRRRRRRGERRRRRSILCRDGP
jgi:hypothetical protein